MNIEDYLHTPEYTQVCILRRLRLLGRIKVTEVAEAIHRSQGNLTLMENGRYTVTQDVIKAYSDYLQTALGIRGDVYAALTKLAEDYPIYSSEAQQHPIDYFCRYLVEMCGGGFEW